MMEAVLHAVVDWGTSSFRLWALDRHGRVLGERRSEQGLAVSKMEGFEAVLESHLAALGVPDGVPVMMCGMAGSRDGWVEVPYVDTPVRLNQLTELAVPASTGKRDVRILPGIAQRRGDHPDVMRGEETQLLAFAAEGHSGLACMPGTHSKWVVLDNGEVALFYTFVTGELFQLVRTASLIGPAVEGGSAVDASSAAFTNGVTGALTTPAEVSNLIFELRAGWLLCGYACTDVLARLSGLLIGLELAGAATRIGSLAGTMLIASGAAASLYHRALVIAGVTDITIRDAETCVRDGLHAAARAAFHQPKGAC